MTDMGPVQLLVIGFGPEARYKGQILDALERLEQRELLRVLGLLVVGQDAATGELVVMDYQGDERGGIVASLLGFALAGTSTDPVVVEASPGAASVGLVRAHLERIARATPPDVAVGVLLVEHLWAREMTRTIREAGGEPLAEGFLSHRALGDVTTQLEETVTILDGIWHAEAGQSTGSDRS
jgi:hypothetical protein